MPETPKNRNSSPDSYFKAQVANREKSRLRAKKQSTSGVWFGLGAFGVVGWAVAVPVVIGVFLGVWIDIRHSGQYSWTLMMLGAGMGLGCLNAWFWLSRQRKSIEKERNGNDT